MKQRQKEVQFRKSKRNFSDINERLVHMKVLQDPFKQFKMVKIRQNPIKITRNKLPPDFFPRTESVRKKVLSTRQSIQQNRNQAGQIARKAESEKNDFSPQKTSFFGFFQQMQKDKKNLVNILNVKRQFETRDQPKREKMYLEHRNLTPMTGSHRVDILEMYPSTQDEVVYEAMSTSKKIKDFQISPRKESNSHIKKVRELYLQDPQKYQQKQEYAREASGMAKNENNHNITFFNVKSSCLPPISKNSGQV